MLVFNDTVSIDKIVKQVERENVECLQKATATTLSRIAGRGRREARKAMKAPQINKPVRFTRDGILFQGADRKAPLDKMESVLFINHIQSEYLAPIIEGETLTELFGQSPFLEPNIRSIKRAAVRRALPFLKVSANGNVKDLGRTLELLRSNKEWVFEITRKGGRLPPGLYFRNKQRNGKGKGLFTLFRSVDASPRKEQFKFFDIGEEVYRDGVGELYFTELQKCLKN